MTAKELSNIKTITDMKRVLKEKINGEGWTGLKTTALKFESVTGGYNIIVKDYEHIRFEMRFDYDDYFGYMVLVDRVYVDYHEDRESVAFTTSRKILDIHTALIETGYYIGTSF